jgi:hypothetical protein
VITCKHCKAEKPEDQMRVWNGKPSKVCLECAAAHPVGGGRTGHKKNGGGLPPRKKDGPL